MLISIPYQKKIPYPTSSTAPFNASELHIYTVSYEINNSGLVEIQQHHHPAVDDYNNSQLLPPIPRFVNRTRPVPWSFLSYPITTSPAAGLIMDLARVDSSPCRNRRSAVDTYWVCGSSSTAGRASEL